jgi:hypothetical protein
MDMVEIDRAIVSLDIFKEYFLCDLARCKGACCIEGDSGAPVTEEEAAFIEKNYPAFKDNLPEEHIHIIETTGFSLIDDDGDRVTPLVENKQCAYSYNEGNGILRCGIEKAFTEEKISFRKPLSCHLFPIRITSYKRFDAVNYQKLIVCRPGRECGETMRLPLYKFLKDPLIRKYGNKWYEKLEIAARYVTEKQEPKSGN